MYLWEFSLASRHHLAVLLVAALTCGCSTAFWEGFAQGAAGTTTAAPRAVYGAPKYMIFGGPGHQTYLGCLNCSEYATDSVLNQYGSHGSPYQTASVFNPYGDFGSRYSAHSACNPHANDPPVIVDGNGNFYGRLTVNAYHAQATRSETWRAWIAGVCASH